MFCKSIMVWKRQFGLAFGLVLGVLLNGCATYVTGTTCEEINLEICSTLPYSQTGTPNMFGHTSQSQQPDQLGGVFHTLITLGCYDNLELFLCAAAFPRCTSSGQLLPPCRFLCESALSACGLWFGFYADIFVNIHCEAMPNSTDPEDCVGSNTSPPSYTSKQVFENTTMFDPTARTNITNSTNEAKTRNTEIYTSSETLFATPSPQQPVTASIADEDKDKKPTNSTVFNMTSSDFTEVSEVIGQRSTESRGDEKWTSVDKTVKTNDMNNQGDSNKSQSSLPTLGIVLSVVSAIGMVLLLISCAFFKNPFGKPFRSRRKPRDAAFYTNPAFDDLPQAGVRNANGQSTGFHQQQPYTLADLPPHPASDEAKFQPSSIKTNPYQQVPGGFTHQNLHVVPESSIHQVTAAETDRENELVAKKQSEGTRHVQEDRSASSDLVYSNKETSIAFDANANEHAGTNESGANQTCAAPSMSEGIPTVNTTIHVDDGDDTIIVNPIAS